MATAANGGGMVSNIVEEATVGGLVISDASVEAVQGGITNGMLFAWNDENAYVNGAKQIVATVTNLSYGAYSTAYIDAQTWLVDSSTNKFCRIWATIIQPSVAAEIRGGL